MRNRGSTLLPADIFLGINGEMSALMRGTDWSHTSMGPIENWPQSLKTTLGILLHSRFPMFLFWGPELLCFYNDAFVPSLGKDGKHPHALGSKAQDVWPEMWTTIYPMILEVMKGNKAIWSKDQLIPIYRNGTIEDAYWTYSYSQVFDEENSIAGVFVAVAETTAEVRMIKELEESENQYRNMIAQTPVGIAVLKGPDLVVETANEFYLQIVDKKSEQMIGRPLFSSLPEVAGSVEGLLQGVMASGQPYQGNEFPVSMRRFGKDEKMAYFNFTYQPLREKDGVISGVIVVVNEVTDIVLAKHHAEESQQRFSEYVKASPMPIGIYIGRDMRIQTVNDAILKAWGRKNESEVLGKTFREVLPELEGQPFFKLLEDVYTTGVAFHSDNHRVDLVHDGELRTFYFNFTYTPLRDKDGNVYGVMNTALDITDLVVAKKQLERSQQELLTAGSRLSLAMDAGRLGSYDLDLLTGKMECNTQCKINFGWEINSAFDFDDLLQSIVEEDRNDMLARLNKSLETRSDFNAEYRVKWPDDSIHWIRTYGKPSYNESGSAMRVAGITIDITESKLAVQKIEESERRLNMTLEYTQTASFDLDLQTRALIANNRMAEIFGYEPGTKLTFENLRSRFHPDDREGIVEPAYERAMTSGNYFYEARVLVPGSSPRWIRTQGKVTYNDRQQPFHMLGTVMDITAEKNEQRRKDEFMGIVTHELKTPLTSVKAFTQFLHQRSVISGDQQSAALLSKMEKQVERLNVLIEDLLDVTKVEGGKMKFQLAAFNFNMLVQEICAEMRLITTKKIILEEKDLNGVIVGDKYRTGQVITNFLSNAIKYSPGADRVVVRVFEAGNEMICEVQDFGIGIGKENQSKLFQRFYREIDDVVTFPGLGLGLYISSEIIKRQNGRIWVDSEKGEGSIFGFSLPINLERSGQ